MIIQKKQLKKSNNGPQKRENKIGTPTVVGLRKEKLQFGPYNILVLPETLKFLFLTTVRALSHWSTDKTKAFMNQYWWENINKAVKIAYLTCPKYNPGKPVCTAIGHFKLPNGSCKIQKLGFLQLPPYHGINMLQPQYVCFDTGLKPFITDRLLSLMWLKSFQKRVSTLEQLLLNLTAINKLILLVRYFGQFYRNYTRRC